MNWNTLTFGDLAIQSALKVGMADLCDHVTGDESLAYAMASEIDSFGPVGQYIMCKDCYADYKSEVDNEAAVCHDCHGEFPASQCREWRWYDFYSPQGDEAFRVCDTCRTLYTHKRRELDDRLESLKEADYMGRDVDEAIWAVEAAISKLITTEMAERQAEEKVKAEAEAEAQRCVHNNDGCCWLHPKGCSKHCHLEPGSFCKCPIYVPQKDKAHGSGEPYRSTVQALREVSKILANGRVSDVYADKIKTFINIGLDIKRGM